ncbi:MAG: NUDIX hydrolase [Lysobacterales bacterium]|jgi:ADP-ribose pyrophosphatase
MPEDILHFSGRYLDLIERDGWEFVSRNNAHAVAVLCAVTRDNEIVLVEQFRRPVNERVIELPAGLVGDTGDPDEQILEAAGRELIEETGFEAGSLEMIMQCPTSSGLTSEVISFVLARDLQRIGSGGGDETEDIEVHVVPLDRVDEWLNGKHAGGLALDPKIFAALHWLNRKEVLQTS